MDKKKTRLDTILVEKGFFKSRNMASAVIMEGKVLVNSRIIDKPGIRISGGDDIIVKTKDIPYVSRGGLKLEKALKEFKINASGLICLDVGASTGGFTDCLLQNKADCVYAVDVGYGQFAWKLRQDLRVMVIERTNIRHMPPEKITKQIDLIVIDVSFISLKIVIPAILKFVLDKTRIICLIKPQFEAGKGKVGKGGVIRDSALHDEIIKNLTEFVSTIGLVSKGVVPSPILGTKGNKEFLMYIKKKV